MKYSREIEIINELYQLAEFKDGNGLIQDLPPIDDAIKDYESDSSKHDKRINAINILFSDASKYYQLIEEYYGLNKDLFLTISQDSVLKFLYWLLKKLKFLGRLCEEQDVKNFYHYFLTQKIIEYHLINEIFGIKGEIEKTLSLGGFNIFKRDKMHEFIEERTGSTMSKMYRLCPKFQSEYLIECKVNAREQIRATELSFKMFDTFESVLRFIIADTRMMKSPGIFNFKGHRVSRTLVFSELGLGSQHKTIYTFDEVDITEPCLTESKFGFDKVWSILSKTDRTKLENIILNSIEWIGKAIYEQDKRKALVEYIFSIENLLHYDKKEYISSSIVSRLAESVAFMLGSSLDERKEIAKSCKEIYKARSAISHGSEKIIDFKSLENAFLYSRGLIIELLSNPVLKDIHSSEALVRWINDKKFS